MKLHARHKLTAIAFPLLITALALFISPTAYANPGRPDEGGPDRLSSPAAVYSTSSAPGYCPSIGGSHEYEYLKDVVWTRKSDETLEVKVVVWIENPTDCVSGDPCPEYDDSPEYINAWIDWNGDKAFDESERVLDVALTGYLGIDYYGAMSTSTIVTIPSDAVDHTWMRVNLGWRHDPNDPCEYEWTWGDVVDKGIGLTRILPAQAAALARNEAVLGAPYVNRKGHYSEQSKYYFDTPAQIGEKGLDCSGLSFWSYNRAYYGAEGLTSEEFEHRPLYFYGADGQYDGNIKDDAPTEEELIPGDLMFFDAYDDSHKGWKDGYQSTGQDGHIDHVAMYVGPFAYEGEEYNVVEATGSEMEIVATTIDKIKERVSKLGGEDSFVGFGRVRDRQVPLKIEAHSPVHLVVTDPDGISLTKEMRDTFGMAYMQYDITGDGEIDDIVVSSKRKVGNYSIEVIPEPDALPTDTYSLVASIGGRTIVLAQDVQISDIPTEPYVITSTSLITLTGDYQDYPTDANTDGVFDHLTVDVGVALANPGWVVAKGRLVDSTGKEIVWAENTAQLEAGPQEIHLDFDGRAIYGHLTDGPYYLKDVYVYHTGDATLADYAHNPYVTASYSYTDFAHSTETATGTGSAFFGSSSGNLENLTAIEEASLPTDGKPDLVFPHGLFSFNITQLDLGETVTVTIVLPEAVPAATQYWKHYSPEGWVNATSLLGDKDGDNVLTLTLTDGGLGDQGGTDGQIVDPGGPGIPPSKPIGGVVLPGDPIRMLVPWATLAALACVVLAGGTVAIKKRMG